MNMTTIITYNDGQTIMFNDEQPLELDLESTHGKTIFSIQVFNGARVVFSAYRWSNNPECRNQQAPEK